VEWLEDFTRELFAELDRGLAFVGGDMRKNLAQLQRITGYYGLQVKFGHGKHNYQNRFSSI
jgi:hypothetical protein